MQKSTLAVCLVMIVVGMTFVTGMAETREGSPGESDSIVHTVTYTGFDGGPIREGTPVSDGDVFVIDGTVPEGETGPRMFDGWQVNGSGDVLREGDRFTVTEDVKLVPVLIDRPQYTVEYSSFFNTLQTSTAYHGIPYVIDANVPLDPNRVFIAWYYDGGYYVNGNTLNVTEDIVLEAEWRNKEHYTLKFINDGATVKTVTNILEDSTITIDVDTPEDDNRVFTGWKIGNKTLFNGDEVRVTNSMALEAQWRDKEYFSVTYRIDGEEHSTVDGILEGTEHTIDIEDPTDPLFIFLGWTDGTDTYQRGDSVKMDSDIVLDAIWREKERFTLTFDADGIKHTVEDVLEGSSYTIDIEDPTDEKRIFLGWTDGDGTYVKGDSIPVNSDTELKATWRDKATYTVTYMVDGQRFGEPVTVLERDTVEVKSDTPVDEDRVFVEWSDGENPYSAGDTVTPSGDVVLTAVWRDKELYSVTFKIDGGEYRKYTGIKEGSEYVIDAGTPEDREKIFLGWSHDGTTLNDGDSIIMEGDVLLTAEWRDRETFTVTYLVDGELFGDVLEVREGSSHGIIPDIPTDGLRIFVEWSDGSSAYTPGQSLTPTDDVTLHAVWRDRETFSVEFLVDGATFDEDTVLEGTEYTIDTDIPLDETRVFTGWSIGGDLKANGDSVVAEDDLRFDAAWRDKERYTVSYLTDGREFSRQTILEGDSVRIITEVPTDDLRIFTGWSDGSGTYTPGDSIEPAGNLNLNAVWRERETFTITFLVDGETYAEDTALEGKEFVIDVGAPTDEKRIFLGWSPGDGLLENGDVLTMDGDLFLNAAWRDKESYTVTYRVDGIRYGEVGHVLEGDGFRIADDIPADDLRVFTGWSDGTDTYISGDVLEPTGDVILDALWRDKELFDIVFLTDGEEFASTTTLEGSELVIDTDVPTDSLRIFTGWSLGDMVLDIGDSVRVGSDLEFVAAWRDKGVFDLTFTVDGEPYRTIEDVKEGDTVILDLGTPEDEKRIFLGWDLDGRTVNDGDTVIVEEDMSLEALWRDKETYTVTLEVNGEIIGTWDVLEGDTFVPDVETPEDEERIFTGWELDGKVYEMGEPVEVDGDVVLEAKWRDRFVFAITYTVDGKTFATGAVTEGYDGEIIADVPEDVQRVFLGWNLDGDLLNAGDKFAVTGDTALEAQWRDRESYSVTYTVDGETVHEITVTEGEGLTIWSDYTDPQGRTVVGWSDGSATHQTGTTIAVTCDTVLTAVFEETFTVTFSVDGTPVREFVNIGKGSEFTITLEDPEEDRRVFLGWSLDGTTLVQRDSFAVNGDLVLEAVWRDKESYTVTYADIGETVEVLEGETLSIELVPPSSVREFLGWTDGTRTYGMGDEIRPTGDITLNAVWGPAPVEDRPVHRPSIPAPEEPDEPYSPPVIVEPVTPEPTAPSDTSSGEDRMVVPLAIAGAVAALVVAMMAAAVRRS